MRTKLVLVIVIISTAGAISAAPKQSEKLYEVFKVDFGCPRSDNTFKPGWLQWRLPGGCDGDAHASLVFWNVDQTRINLELGTVGDSAMANLRAGPGDQIANTYYTEARDIGRMLRDCCTERDTSIALSIQLKISGPGLTPGEYVLQSYHNISRRRGGMDTMFAITAAGQGVKQLEPVSDVPIQHTRSDDELIPSEIRFRTDGSPVLVVYEAPKFYIDYRDYPGGRAVLNAFRLIRKKP